MKHIFLFTIAAAGLMMASCGKGDADIIPTSYDNENTEGIRKSVMKLDAENVGGQDTRTAVAYNSVWWDSGDVVNINGNDYTVVIGDDANAFTEESVNESEQYYGYHGCGDVTDAQTTTPTVTIPSHYDCTWKEWEDNYRRRQVIALPMAAYSPTNTNTITFRHLTAAMEVLVTNNTGIDDLCIDSVQVTSATQNLCGPVTLDLTAENFGLTPSDGNNRTVTVRFPYASICLSRWAGVHLQVPILPVANKDNDLTVKVFAHNKASNVLKYQMEDLDINKEDYIAITPVDYVYQYSRTKAAPALARNVISRANIQITSTSEDITTFIRNHYFSISSTQKVYFSQGNLQYSYGAWRFADTQWEIVQNRTDDFCDLFYWETQGNYGTEDNCSTPRGTTSDVVNWGDNAISNGGNTPNMWITPSIAQWNYMVGERSGKRFARARLFGTRNGLILFPDNYVHPYGVPEPTYVNDGNGTPRENHYTEEQWAAMEGAGAVFMATTYYRYYGGYSGSDYNSFEFFYWSSTAQGYDETNGYGLLFYLGQYYPNGSRDRRAGYPVRLVRLVN